MHEKFFRKDHEGTVAVRPSKLQLLATRFEKLRMLEDETISDFNSKLCDIANESFALGVKKDFNLCIL